MRSGLLLVVCLAIVHVGYAGIGELQLLEGFAGDIDSLAFDSKGGLYAAGYGFSKLCEIAKIDLETGVSEVVFTGPPDAWFTAIAFDTNDAMLLANPRSNEVLRVADDGTADPVCSGLPAGVPGDFVVSSEGWLLLAGEDNVDWVGSIWLCDDSGVATNVVPDMGRINGIALSRDDSVLYVSEAIEGQVDMEGDYQTIWKFDVNAKTGDVTNKRSFRKLPALDYTSSMRVDAAGRLYVASSVRSAATVFTPTGEEIDRLDFDYLTTSVSIALASPEGPPVYAVGACALEPQTGCMSAYNVPTTEGFWYRHHAEECSGASRELTCTRNPQCEWCGGYCTPTWMCSQGSEEHAVSSEHSDPYADNGGSSSSSMVLLAVGGLLAVVLVVAIFVGVVKFKQRSASNYRAYTEDVAMDQI